MVLCTKRVRCTAAGHLAFTDPLLVPDSPAITSWCPHNAQGLIGTPQSQDTIHQDIIITPLPQYTNADVPRSMATIPRNAIGMLPQCIPPATTSFSGSIVGSPSPHDSTPSSIDILADTAQLTTGGSASPPPAQRESGTSPIKHSSQFLRIVNLTDQDTIRSTSPLSAPDVTPSQLSRPASALSPALVHPSNTRDLSLLVKADVRQNLSLISSRFILIHLGRVQYTGIQQEDQPLRVCT